MGVGGVFVRGGSIVGAFMGGDWIIGGLGLGEGLGEGLREGLRGGGSFEVKLLGGLGKVNGVR